MTSLADPNTLLFDHLLTLKPVKFLEGELIHDVCLLQLPQQQQQQQQQQQNYYYY